MHEEAVAALACPIEAGPLELVHRSLRCAAGHTFDLARQGYANLVVGRDPGTGDRAEMVEARARFLASGRFAAVTDALVAAVLATEPERGVVVDLGAGTGHHLAAVLDAEVDRAGIAVDLSKHAARRAARSHPRAAAIVADVWQGLPVRTGTAGVVTCVFAPRNATEIARVLRPDGTLVVVTPTSRHLAELVVPLDLLSVDPRKDERLRTAIDPGFTAVGPARTIEVGWQLTHEEVRTVIAMGPSGAHLDVGALAARLFTLPDPVPVTASVEIRTFRPR